MNQHTYPTNDIDVGTTITDAFGTNTNNQFELATSAQSSKALAAARSPNLWHYAPAAYLERITNSGYLRPSNPWAPDELPLLWFSANQLWEPTATKMICDTNGLLRPLTYSEMKQIGIIRFGISASDPRLMTCKSACSLAGTPPQIRRCMEEVGIEVGANPNQWFATSTAISTNELSLQIWADGWKANEAEVPA